MDLVNSQGVETIVISVPSQLSIQFFLSVAGKGPFCPFLGPRSIQTLHRSLMRNRMRMMMTISWGLASRMQRLMSSAQVLLMHLAHGCNIRHGIQCNTIIYEYNTLAHRCNIGHGIQCNTMNMSLCHGI